MAGIPRHLATEKGWRETKPSWEKNLVETMGRKGKKSVDPHFENGPRETKTDSGHLRAAKFPRKGIVIMMKHQLCMRKAAVGAEAAVGAVAMQAPRAKFVTYSRQPLAPKPRDASVSRVTCDMRNL